MTYDEKNLPYQLYQPRGCVSFRKIKKELVEAALIELGDLFTFERKPRPLAYFSAGELRAAANTSTLAQAQQAAAAADTREFIGV